MLFITTDRLGHSIHEYSAEAFKPVPLIQTIFKIVGTTSEK